MVIDGNSGFELGSISYGAGGFSGSMGWPLSPGTIVMSGDGNNLNFVYYFNSSSNPNPIGVITYNPATNTFSGITSQWFDTSCFFGNCASFLFQLAGSGSYIYDPTQGSPGLNNGWSIESIKG